MSEPFIVAAALPMTAAGHAAWLATSLPAPSTFGDWEAMYTGWYWEGTPVLAPADDLAGSTVGAWIAEQQDAATSGATLICIAHHTGDTLLFYAAELMGPAHAWSQHALTVIRSAAPHLARGGHAVYWAETSGLVTDPRGVLAMCRIDPADPVGSPASSAFVDPAALAAAGTSATRVLATLAPVEQAFNDYFDRQFGGGAKQAKKSKAKTKAKAKTKPKAKAKAMLKAKAKPKAKPAKAKAKPKAKATPKAKAKPKAKPAKPKAKPARKR